jgi:predicted porin
LNPGYVTIGGYVLAVTNNTNFGLDKTLDYWWAGVKWTATPKLELTLSYLGIDQNSFATGATAGCNSAASAKCSGREYALGALVDYRLSKRFDAYLGTLYTDVSDGLANGFLFTSTLTTTTGIRFRF